MNKKICLLLFIILGTALFQPRDTKNCFTEFLPSNPTMDELGKFKEILIDKYIGKAEEKVSIPISPFYETHVYNQLL